jgi:hypothetical protein
MVCQEAMTPHVYKGHHDDDNDNDDEDMAIPPCNTCKKHKPKSKVYPYTK